MRHQKITFQFLKQTNSKLNFVRFFSSEQQSHFDDVGPLASQLKSRTVIRFTGPDTFKFLQGLLTNDVCRFEKPSAEKTSTLPTSNLATISTPPVYAAMLNPRGIFLYDFFLYQAPRQDEIFEVSGSGPGRKSEDIELFADVDRNEIGELLETLKKYRLRQKVDIDHVGEEYSCWQCYGGKASEKSSDVEDPGASAVDWGGNVDLTSGSSAHGTESGWQWFRDPRLDCLGLRGIFPSDSIPPLVEADKETDEKIFLYWRVMKGVAEGSSEISKGEAMPLHYNLLGLKGISLTKGCYVGRELVARAHHRGVIRRRLLPLKFVDDSGREVEQRVVPLSEVIDPTNGKVAGRVTTALGSRGLGPLVVKHVFRGSRSFVVKGNEDVKVEIIRPEWWPRHWFLDQEWQM